MSLINKMLRDLDERRASELERDGVSRHIRTLPAEKKFQWKAVLLVCAGALAGAVCVGLILNWRQGTGSDVHLPVPQTQAKPAPPAIVIDTPPPAPLPPPAAPMTRETLASPTAVARAPRSDKREPVLKLDRSFDARVDQGTPAALPASEPEAKSPGDPSAGAQLIEKQPRTPVVAETSDAEYRRGLSLVRRGAPNDAAVAFRAALQGDARHVAARQALLSLLVEQQQLGEAESTGLAGLALDPKQSGWAMLVARLQVERNDLATAVATLDRYAQQADRNADYMAFHALLLQRMKRLPESIEQYRAALTVKPGEGRWWYGLGLVLEASQRPDDARQAFAQARAAGNLPADLAAAVEQKLKGS